MNNELRLGSLFDGSGGFPLGAIFCGIKPIWSSEVEPFPIRFTQKNLPQVKYLGDIKDIDGSEIEPVDIITFGSPCQDLSIAGKRAGLEGKKSNLFYEAIRVIKEMRCKTNGKYPRYLLWENVPGAFSSNKGEDFKKLKKTYPVGTRVKLIQMEDDQATPVGTLGTVYGVDSIGSILVKWDNGSMLNVIFREDRIEKILNKG